METTTTQLLELSSSELLNEMTTLQDLAAKKGAEWAEVHHEAKAIKEMLPSILASLQRFYFVGKVTMAQAKMQALSHEAYRAKVEKMSELELKAEKIKVEYKALCLSLEGITSISYLKNQELKLGR